MKKTFHLDDKVYADLLKMLNALHLNEHIGQQCDMDFIKCPKRAVMMASFMRRLAAKDQRGTLEINIDDFKLPKN